MEQFKTLSMTLFYVTCTFFTFLSLCMRSVMLQINEYNDMMMMLVLPCSNRVKAYLPYYSNRVFTISQSKYSTSTKSPLQVKNSTFLWQGHRQNVSIRIHQNAPFSSLENHLFWGGGIAPFSDPFPGRKWYPSPHNHPSLQPSLLDPPSVLPEFRPDLHYRWGN